MNENKRWIITKTGYHSGGKFIEEYNLTDLASGLRIEFGRNKELAEMLLAVLNFIGTKLSFKYPAKIG